MEGKVFNVEITLLNRMHLNSNKWELMYSLHITVSIGFHNERGRVSRHE